MNKEKSAMKLSYWAEKIREANNSGKSITTWCKENQITPRVYYYWHGKVMHSTYKALLNRGYIPPVADDVNVPAVQGIMNPTTTVKERSEPVFVELPVSRDSSEKSERENNSTGIMIHMGNISISVDHDFSASTLSKVLEVMSHVQ